jgi:perosamine synthetase
MDNFENTIFELKKNPEFEIVVFDQHGIRGSLTPITFFHVGNDDLIRHLVKWRNENIEAYLDRSKASFEGTRAWLAKRVLDNKGKILFILKNGDGDLVGHIGLSAQLDINEPFLEIDNVVRGEKSKALGLMSLALFDLVSWVFLISRARLVFLRVLSDNSHAISFYENLGFSQNGHYGLRTLSSDAEMQNFELDGTRNNTEPSFVRMELVRNSHFMRYANVKARARAKK